MNALILALLLAGSTTPCRASVEQCNCLAISQVEFKACKYTQKRGRACQRERDDRDRACRSGKR